MNQSVLSKILNIFTKEKVGKQEMLGQNKHQGSLNLSSSSSFKNLVLIPCKSLGESLYKLLDIYFSNEQEGYVISWAHFFSTFISDGHNQGLSPELISTLILKEDHIEELSDYEELDSTEGVSSLDVKSELGHEMLSLLPRVVSHSRYCVDITIKGFEEIQEPQLYIELKGKKHNITEQFKQQGPLLKLKLRGKESTYLVPLWAYEIFKSYINEQGHWNFSNKALIAGLQGAQEWLRDIQSPDQLLLTDVRFDNKSLTYLQSFDLSAVSSLNEENKACLVPCNEKLIELLAYPTELETLNAIQRAIRNHDFKESVIYIDAANNKKIGLVTTQNTLNTLKALREYFFNKEEVEIINAIRYHSDDSIIKTHPQFGDVFNLDINNYGRRVIGLGAPPLIPNLSVGSSQKSLLGEIDELIKDEPERVKKEVKTVDGREVACISLSTGNEDHNFFIFQDEVDEIFEATQEAHEKNELFTFTDAKTKQKALLDLTRKDSFNAMKKQLLQARKKSFKLKNKDSELNALIIEDQVTDFGYDETNQIIDKELELEIDEILELLPGKKPFDYQSKCIKWLAKSFLNFYPGVLLADDMGLGKTFQTMCFMRLLTRKLWHKRLSSDMQESPILIVVPPILLKNFNEQAKDFFSHPQEFGFKELHGNEIQKYYRSDIDTSGKEIKSGYNFLDTNKLKQEKCIVTTYDTLANYEHTFAKISWSLLLCDEVQKAKSVQTNVSRVLKAVASKSHFKILMSGTPIENNMFEFWNLLDTCVPGLLGSQSDFKQTYSAFFKESSSEDQKKEFDCLNEKIKFGDFDKGYVNGRLKEEVAKNLPKLNSYNITFNLDPVTLNTIEDILRSDVSSLEKIGKIKQYSIHSFLCEPYNEREPEEWMKGNNRIEKLCEILENIKRKEGKVLIFCEYHEYQRCIQSLINDKYNIGLIEINSKVDRYTRDDVLKSFQRHIGFAALVLSPKCAGMGLNLQEANHIIHLTRWWNPAVEDQATCRAYRTGQTKDVNVYYFVANHYFEQTLHERLEMKRSMRKNLFDINYTQDVEKTGLTPEVSQNSDFSIEDCAHSIKKIDSISGKNTSEQGSRFEQVIQCIYEKMGYKAIKPGGRDRGIDLVLIRNNGTKIGVQVKHVSGGRKFKGFKDIQAFPSALRQHDYTSGIFITNGEYIDSHVQDQMKINGDLDIQWLQRKDLCEIINGLV